MTAIPAYALTVWEPWASAIVFGPKRVENRVWAPPEHVVGKRIWIHAGRHLERSVLEDLKHLWPEMPETFPSGAIIGSAKVLGWMSKAHVFEGDLMEHRRSPFFHGPIGWVLDDVRALREPVPCRGLQKLWTPKEPSVIARLEELYRRTVEKKERAG